LIPSRVLLPDSDGFCCCSFHHGLSHRQFPHLVVAHIFILNFQGIASVWTIRPFWLNGAFVWSVCVSYFPETSSMRRHLPSTSLFRVRSSRRQKLATYLYSSVTLATVQGFGQKRSLRASTRRELSFGTNVVLIRRVRQKFQ
jgi:hypothetical protein